jgi:hypothetical protein
MQGVAWQAWRDIASHHRPQRRSARMSDSSAGLRLGHTVPDFELTTFDPVKGDFGKFSLKDQIARQRWTILFFYPADFTFV